MHILYMSPASLNTQYPTNCFFLNNLAMIKYLIFHRILWVFAKIPEMENSEVWPKSLKWLFLNWIAHKKICENILIEVRYRRRNNSLWSSNAIMASNKLTVTNHITPLSGAEQYFFKQGLSVEPEQRNKLYSHMLWILFLYSHISYTYKFFFIHLFSFSLNRWYVIKLKKKKGLEKSWLIHNII